MWTTVEGSSHPLAQLEVRPLIGASLAVRLGPQNRYGARYFQIRLRDGTGRESQPFLVALHQSGPYPSVNWIEVMKLDRTLVFPNQEIVLSEEEIVRLFRYLSDLIPPGGHMMVEYDSAEWQETRLSISCGIPPVATPLGDMLFRIGCGVAFKDWWFAEGVHPKAVSDRLGHATVGITLDTYSHVTPGLQEAAALRFDQALVKAQ